MNGVKEIILKDISGAKVVQVTVDNNRGVIWVNTEMGCVLRICKIESPVEVVIEEAYND